MSQQDHYRGWGSLALLLGWAVHAAADQLGDAQCMTCSEMHWHKPLGIQVLSTYWL